MPSKDTTPRPPACDPLIIRTGPPITPAHHIVAVCTVRQKELTESAINTYIADFVAVYRRYSQQVPDDNQAWLSACDPRAAGTTLLSRVSGRKDIIDSFDNGIVVRGSRKDLLSKFRRRLASVQKKTRVGCGDAAAPITILVFGPEKSQASFFEAVREHHAKTNEFSDGDASACGLEDVMRCYNINSKHNEPRPVSPVETEAQSQTESQAETTPSAKGGDGFNPSDEWPLPRGITGDPWANPYYAAAKQDIERNRRRKQELQRAQTLRLEQEIARRSATYPHSLEAKNDGWGTSDLAGDQATITTTTTERRGRRPDPIKIKNSNFDAFEKNHQFVNASKVYEKSTEVEHRWGRDDTTAGRKAIGNQHQDDWAQEGWSVDEPKYPNSYATNSINWCIANNYDPRERVPTGPLPTGFKVEQIDWGKAHHQPTATNPPKDSVDVGERTTWDASRRAQPDQPGYDGDYEASVLSYDDQAMPNRVVPKPATIEDCPEDNYHLIPNW